MISGYEHQLVAFRDSNRALLDQRAHLHQLTLHRRKQMEEPPELPKQELSDTIGINDADAILNKFMLALDYSGSPQVSDRHDIDEIAGFERMLAMANDELSAAQEEKHEVLARLDLQYQHAVQQLADAKLQ